MRCYRTHAEGDQVIGQLHRAWEDFVIWGWARRNIVSDAHPPRVPRKGRKVWTVAQLQRFLQAARSDRFFAL